MLIARPSTTAKLKKTHSLQKKAALTTFINILTGLLCINSGNKIQDTERS